MEYVRGKTTPRWHVLLIQAVDYDTQSLVGFQPLCTPLSIATIAALTSDDYSVDMWDENLDGLLDERSTLPRAHYDIVGISTLFEHVGHRVPTLAELFRQRGAHICAGGPGISNQLKMISACVDTIFLNEAEYTWPQFLGDWAAGAPRREYVQVEKPLLAASPPPKWDAIADRIPRYRAGGVQTTRGCPFDCEFCDVIYLYGRAQRHKPVANVLTEVSNLRRLGAKRVFFTDDEFIGDPRYSRELLTELIALNNSFEFPLAYHTQLTLNLSLHPDLMRLIADANFWHALIGIESFNEQSLKETHKLQNCHRDIVADCRTILSHGIGINGSFIVGFDHDGPDVFDNILNGVRRACIPFASVSILRATYGTKLWTRLREEKRLWKLRDAESLPQALQMDILPGGSLSRAQLIEGRIDLNKELSKVRNVCERLNGWLNLLQRVPQVDDRHEIRLDAAIQRIADQKTLSLTREESSAIGETLAHAQEKAPIMMGRLVDSILAQLYWYRIRTHHTETELQRALAAERQGELVPDSQPLLIPSAFASAFRTRLFAYVYTRLAQNLPDSSRVPELASEIFVDFLIRIRDEVGASSATTLTEPRYLEFLRLLCDRATSRATGQNHETFVPVESAEPMAMTPVKRRGLYDAVLKDVSDRLCRLNS